MKGRRKERPVFGLRTEKRCARSKMPRLCIFAYLFHSSGDTGAMYHQQSSRRLQTARTGAWPVWLIRLVPTAFVRSGITPKNIC
jgi:hypothetical protein